jgi:hypothetical protein
VGRRGIAAAPPERGLSSPVIINFLLPVFFSFSFSCAGRFWVDRSGKICSSVPARWGFLTFDLF